MKRVSPSTVRRLSLYLRHLEDEPAGGTVSSNDLARAAGTTPAQVRKDLSVFGSFGVRGIGYEVEELRRELRSILGLDRAWTVVLVGAGKIGAALYSYEAFRARGFEIRAVVDADPSRIGERWGDRVVRSVDDLEAVVRSEGIDMAVVAVPADAAEAVSRRLVAAGVRAILNFAPVKIEVPEGVIVRDVDMTLELEGLAYALTAAQVAGDSDRRLSSAR